MTVHGSARADSPSSGSQLPSKGAERWARRSGFCAESFHSRKPPILKMGKGDSSDTSPTPHRFILYLFPYSLLSQHNKYRVSFSFCGQVSQGDVQALVSSKAKPEVMATAIQRLVWGRLHSHSHWQTWFLASWALVQGSWLLQ